MRHSKHLSRLEASMAATERAMLMLALKGRRGKVAKVRDVRREGEI